MQVVLLVLLGVLCSFAFVVLFGAPYVPTLRRQREVALDLLDLKPGQTLLELGCGDGTMCIAAARRGLYVIGYELNPLLFGIAWIRTRPYRKHVTVRYANYWSVSLPRADGVFVFLLDRFMSRLDTKLDTELPKPFHLASYTFKVPGRKALREKSGVFLYEYN